MVADHFIDHEADEFLAEFGIEIGLRRQLAQPGNLPRLAVRIGGGQGGARLVFAHSLGDAEAFGQHVDQRGVDIVDAAAEAGKLGIGGRIGHAWANVRLEKG